MRERREKPVRVAREIGETRVRDIGGTGELHFIRALIEGALHELVHHLQRAGGLFKQYFESESPRSQLRIEIHARLVTDKILKSLFGFGSSPMGNEERKYYKEIE